MNLYEATLSPDLELAAARVPEPRGPRGGKVSQRPALRAYADNKVVSASVPSTSHSRQRRRSGRGRPEVDTALVEASAQSSSCILTSTPAASTPQAIDEDPEVGEAVAGIGVARIAPEGNVSTVSACSLLCALS